jgi:hypothetical protein
MQPLESRVLLSSPLGGPGGGFPKLHGPGGLIQPRHGGPGAPGGLGAAASDPTVQQDRADLKAALQTLRNDRRSGMETIRADQQAVRAEYQNLIDAQGEQVVHDAIQPARDKLREDTRLKNKEIRAAAADLKTISQTYAETIRADLQALRDAREGGVQATIDAARAKFDTDAKALEDALAPTRANIQAVKDKWRPIIVADNLAIQAELEKLDPALAPLYDKLNADATALDAKLTADAQAIADITKKLAADILAAKTAAA